jgi:hypothetical protein
MPPEARQSTACVLLLEPSLLPTTSPTSRTAVAEEEVPPGRIPTPAGEDRRSTVPGALSRRHHLSGLRWK